MNYVRKKSIYLLAENNPIIGISRIGNKNSISRICEVCSSED